MKPIVGSIIVYIVQLLDDMICTNILIEKVSCMCLVGLIVIFVLLYYMYMLGMSGIVLIGKQKWTKTYTITCLD